MSWAEITGDDSIPDTRPPVATPERILAGLSDDDKLNIMGSKRYEMYLNGMKLQDMVDVVPNRDWGPTTRVLPLRDIGEVSKPKPATPKPITPVVKPKPIEQSKPVIAKPETVTPKPTTQQPKPKEVKPAIVKPVEQVQIVEQAQPAIRTAEGLRDKLRSIESSTSETIQKYKAQLKELEIQLDAFDKTPDGEFDLARIFNNPNLSNPEYISLQKQIEELGQKIYVTDNQKRTLMHDALKSEKPLQISYVSPDDAIYRKQLNRADSRNAQAVMPTKQDHRQWVDGLEIVTSWIDERPLKPVIPLPSDVKPNQLFIVEGKGRRGVGGWFSHGNNVIAINKTGSTFRDTFDDIVSHEFIHYLDMNDPKLRQATSNFYKYRTRLDSPQMHPQGLVKVDNWGRDYAGLVASDPLFTGIEVPTVGIEFLLKDPLAFAERDFEYFKFMVENVLWSSQQ
jgi:hypothetical protein